ncbi:MAG: ribbon-helix-helix domain-containing protein [Rhodomicrobium sp.]
MTRKPRSPNEFRSVVRSLKRTVAEEVAKVEPKGDPRGMIRQTLYLPPAVHDQLRLLAFNRRESQQEIIRQGLNMLFEREGLPKWDELATSKEEEPAASEAEARGKA